MPVRPPAVAAEPGRGLREAPARCSTDQTARCSDGLASPANTPGPGAPRPSPHTWGEAVGEAKDHKVEVAFVMSTSQYA